MKEKIINYIEILEAKAYQSDDYFKQRNDLYIENQNKDKEIERLNNIINELEEELERESNMKEEDTCLEHNTFIDIKNTLKTVLKRLQELKGSDSNE